MNTINLLLPEAEAEVTGALLRLALSGHGDAIEHTDLLPPVGPEKVLYRRRPLEVEELSWSPGGAKVSQEVTVWAPAGATPTGTVLVERVRGRELAGAALGNLHHVKLGEVTRATKHAVLSDGTTVTTGVYSVEVYPYVPLILDRLEQAPRVALGDRHRGHEVGKVGPVEGTPEHRTQKVELVVVTNGKMPAERLREMQGRSTVAGYVTEAEPVSWGPDKIGSGSLATATPSHNRVNTKLVVTLAWRES